MKMIPSSPHGTHSMAEKRVFDRLESAFIYERESAFTAYHSLNLTHHHYKRFGEIDFLIVGPPGLFVLEVKGGKVACQKGVWQFTNRYGVGYHSVEGPFKQAESALHGLMIKLNSHFSPGFLSQFPRGFGVIFPDCQWDIHGVEWDQRTLMDSHRFNDLETWLTSLFRYWQQKHPLPKLPDPDSITQLNSFLRPEFETVETLFSQVGQLSEQVAILTRGQMAFLDVIDANARVLCSGGAGTGKTFLAMELARRWSFQDKKILMPCASKWLKRYLETRFSIPGLTLALIDTLEVEAQRACVDQFDALIVDEGQDLFDRSRLAQMDRFLKGGLLRGRWCIFHDKNNQATALTKSNLEGFTYLNAFSPAKVPLNTNCRNTLAIINKVKSSLGADMGVRGGGCGPDVREKSACSKIQAMKILSCELTELVDHGHIPPSCITILSPLSFEDSVVFLLPPEVRDKIIVLDEFSMRNFPPGKISFTQILQFKGLENEAIILVDMPPPDPSMHTNCLHYVAMSRPRAVLSIIFEMLIETKENI